MDHVGLVYSREESIFFLGETISPPVKKEGKERNEAWIIRFLGRRLYGQVSVRR